ncbi:950_t:CDS:2 [Cetraspora pellucida]|uniref:950_t:CDS:1 n=1 Tax=Cetraspora pellucida TaxID=1433469 RepID=A0A9N8ZUK3_9GLOM|nr:950_t:CDS:2 [Cetraspora pellucida]
MDTNMKNSGRHKPQVRGIINQATRRKEYWTGLNIQEQVTVLSGYLNWESGFKAMLTTKGPLHLTGNKLEISI